MADELTPSRTSNRPAAAARLWPVHLKLVGMAALWGASWPSGRVLAQSLPPLTAASWRFGLALLLLVAWLAASGGVSRLKALSARQWWGLAAAGSVGVFGYSVFFMAGLAHVPAGRAALVVTTNPVLTTLIAAWWFGERLDARIALGMVLATVGAATVLTHGEPWRLFAGAIGYGELLLLGCAATWVAYTLMGRRLLSGIDPLCTTTMTAGFGLVMLLAAALLIEGPAAITLPWRAGSQVWVALAFLAIGATVLAYAWYFEGVSRLGAGAAAGYISLVPLFGVLSAAPWLGERVDAAVVVGGALSFVGMVVMNVSRR